MADEKSTVLGIRLDTEERKRFDEFVDEEGKNNKEFLNTLLNLYELNKGKVKNINLVGDIETLEGYTNKIHQAFINIIDKLESQKGDIIDDSQKDLRIYKDKVNDLQTKIDIAKSINSMNDEKLTSVNSDNISLKEQNNQFQQIQESNKALIEEYKGKNDMLLNQLKQYEKFPEQLESTKGLLADTQAIIIERDNIIKENEWSIKELNKNITDNKNEWISISDRLKNEHEQELQTVKDKLIFDNNNVIKEKDFTVKELNKTIDTLKQDNLKDLEGLKKESELNIKLAVVEAKEELNNKLNQAQLKHNTEIEEYQNKYKSLLEELEKVRTVHSTTKKTSNAAAQNK